jgi:glutamine amidotransferase
MIVVIDYHCGNLGSIVNMFRRLGVPSLASSRAEDIAQADQLILPGVGAFDHGMRNLREMGILPLLERKVFDEQTPLLGICLGMQLLSHCSEEGSEPGLGWLDAETVRFRPGESGACRIPHMGWNSVVPANREHGLLARIENPRFYFVHSYHVVCRKRENILATTTYGIEFHSAVARDNIAGTQFHPEKSHRYGLSLLANFARQSHVSSASDPVPPAAWRRAG